MNTSKTATKTPSSKARDTEVPSDLAQVGLKSKGDRDSRKKQLIDATIRIIGRHGLSNTTIARVTGEAGLSAGIVSFHFDSKEKLLVETLVWIRDEFEAVVAEYLNRSGDGPRERLKALVRAHFDPRICSYDKIAVWWAFTSESSARSDYMEVCGNHDQWLQDFVVTEVRKLLGTGNKSDARVEALARGLIGLVEGFAQDYLHQPEGFDPKNGEALAMTYLETLFPISRAAETVTKEEPVSQERPKESDLLPRWTYRDPEFLDLERRRLFKRNWLLVCHVNDIPEPRDFRTFDAVGERALVVRGRDGQVRAFHNVCRHRGAKLLDRDSGSCPRVLTCPFHGWTYGLDGKLIGVPAQKTFDGLVKSKNGLVPLDLEIWHGLVFVRFQSGGSSLADTMAPVNHLIEPYRLQDMLPLAGTDYHEIKPYNWKIIHDIDNEGYHVPVGHPALNQLYGESYVDGQVDDIPVSRATLNEIPGINWSVNRYQALLPTFDHLPEENQRLWLYIGIFPSMVIGLYPDSVEYYMTLPLDIDRTVYRGAAYGLPDSRRGIDAVRYLNRRINRETSEEDESFVRWMQEGLDSSAFPEQKLSSLESGVRVFHKRIQQELPVARLANQPGMGMTGAMNDRASVLA